MYEHPYLSQRATELELEQLERALARRRFMMEHADQIVLRPESALRRAVRRMLGMAPGNVREAVARTTSDAAPAATTADAASGSRRGVPCEPLPVR